jgi:hypothetical protein
MGSWSLLGGALTVLALVLGNSERVATASWAGGTGTGQQAPSRTPRLDPGAASPPFDPDSAGRDEDRMKMVNDERRKQIPAQTDKLVILTTELKAMVDKAPGEEMPVAAIRKAAEIEKLARDVKSRMQN